MFVLFLLSIRPYFESRRLDELREERVRNEQVVRPMFLKAMRHYEKGQELMTSDDPDDLVSAQREFIKALAIDPRYKEAMAALQETQAKLEKIEGYRHYIEPPVHVEGVVEPSTPPGGPPGETPAAPPEPGGDKR